MSLSFLNFPLMLSLLSLEMETNLKYLLLFFFLKHDYEREIWTVYSLPGSMLLFLECLFKTFMR